MALVGVFLLTTGTASAQVTSCADDVTSSGVHTIDSDITDSTASSCINITASDVVLEGNDNTVDGVDNDSGSIGVNVSASTTLSNITVRNVNTTGWGDPFSGSVTVGNAGGVDIEDLNATLNGGNGVDVLNAAGAVNISNSTVARNGEKGVAVDSAGSPATFVNNVFRRNGGGGDAAVRFDDDGNYTFRDNLFVNNTDEALRDGGLVDSDTITLQNDTFVGTVAEAIDTSAAATFVGTSVTFRTPNAGATVDFESRGVNFNETFATPDDPVNNTNASEYLNITDELASPTYLNVTFKYDPANLPAR